MEIFASTGAHEPIVSQTVDTPTPTGREVLLKVRQSGVCHSDVHLQEGSFDMGSQGKAPLAALGMKYPLVFGHEIVGEVEAVGPDVTTVKPGDIRLVFPWIGCGECFQCRNEQENYCARPRNLGVQKWGGFAREVLVPSDKYLLDIEGLDPAWAATLACSGVTSFSATAKALPVGEEETVAVIGTGGVGLMAIAILKARGVKNIAAVDVSDERLAIAKELGATIAVNSSEGNPVEALQQAAGGPVASVIDFVNNGATSGLAFSALRKGGTMVSVGLFGGELALPTSMIALQCISIRGNYVGSLPELTELVELAKSGALPRLPVIEKDLNEENINAGLSALAEGTVAGRTVLHQA